MPILVIGGLLVAATMLMTLHQVDQGHVGVYYRGGALLDKVTTPGFHTHTVPFVDSMRQVQVTMQTDQVTNVPCGTQGGVMIYFDRIEVVNQLQAAHVHETVNKFTTGYDQPLIFDKVHHELNQFCSSHTLQEVYVDMFDQIDENLKTALEQGLRELAPGLTVLAVRVTKPKIPLLIQQNYEKMEAEKTKFMIEEQKQKVTMKEAETSRKQAEINAEKEAMVAKIKTDSQMVEKESLRKMSATEDTTNLARKKAEVDAQFYRAEKDAEANQKRLTPEYLELMKYQALANNTKIFFGPDIPTYFGSLLEKK